MCHIRQIFTILHKKLVLSQWKDANVNWGQRGWQFSPSRPRNSKCGCGKIVNILFNYLRGWFFYNNATFALELVFLFFSIHFEWYMLNSEKALNKWGLLHDIDNDLVNGQVISLKDIYALIELYRFLRLVNFELTQLNWSAVESRWKSIWTKHRTYETLM